jgi:hypothetical protein
VDAVDVPVAELAARELLPICALRKEGMPTEIIAGVRRGSSRPERRRRHTNQTDGTTTPQKRLVRNRTSSTDISKRQASLQVNHGHHAALKLLIPRLAAYKKPSST